MGCCNNTEVSRTVKVEWDAVRETLRNITDLIDVELGDTTEILVTPGYIDVTSFVKVDGQLQYDPVEHHVKRAVTRIEFTRTVRG